MKTLVSIDCDSESLINTVSSIFLLSGVIFESILAEKLSRLLIKFEDHNILSLSLFGKYFVLLYESEILFVSMMLANISSWLVLNDFSRVDSIG